jgi:hypothetical protein
MECVTNFKRISYNQTDKLQPKKEISFLFVDHKIYLKEIKTRYSLKIAPINDALVYLAGCKAYANKPYPVLLTLYGQYSKKATGNKWLPFELICAVFIVNLNRFPLVTQCVS